MAARTGIPRATLGRNTFPLAFCTFCGALATEIPGKGTRHLVVVQVPATHARPAYSQVGFQVDGDLCETWRVDDQRQDVAS